MDKDKLQAIIESHGRWLRGEDDGARANLAGANLAGANLAGANLAKAHLADANLAGAYLAKADLAGAYLAGANLAKADLAGANLAGAYLAGAYLAKADLADAYLAGAHLAGANRLHYQIPDGELVVWKKVADKLVRLRIPEDANRTASIIGRKCRAESALVEWIEGGDPVASDGCGNGPKTTYTEGETVYPDSYDDDPRIECTHGIHFFLTRVEAEEW